MSIRPTTLAKIKTFKTTAQGYGFTVQTATSPESGQFLLEAQKDGEYFELVWDEQGRFEYGPSYFNSIKVRNLAEATRYLERFAPEKIEMFRDALPSEIAKGDHIRVRETRRESGWVNRTYTAWEIYKVISEPKINSHGAVQIDVVSFSGVKSRKAYRPDNAGRIEIGTGFSASIADSKHLCFDKK